MNRPSSITSYPLSTPLLSGISPITEQRDRSRAAISWGKLLLGQWQSPLLFHHQRASIWKFLDERKGMGWCGCKVTGRENRTHTRGNENTLYTNSCHVCASWHPLNLIWSFHCTFSLFFTHTYKRSFTRSFFFFFSFSFLNSREQSIRWPREKIRSNCHNIVIIRELFNKHRQMFFDVLYEFLFSFVSLLVYSVYTLVFC